ncbi:hypothetical protein D3C76_766140 [compost metagenome]
MDGRAFSQTARINAVLYGLAQHCLQKILCRAAKQLFEAVGGDITGAREWFAEEFQQAHFEILSKAHICSLSESSYAVAWVRSTAYVRLLTPVGSDFDSNVERVILGNPGPT